MSFIKTNNVITHIDTVKLEIHLDKQDNEDTFI